jgi:hypothetical protein
MPCSEAIEWIISHTNIGNNTIINEEGRPCAN